MKTHYDTTVEARCSAISIIRGAGHSAALIRSDAHINSADNSIRIVMWQDAHKIRLQIIVDCF